MLTERMDVSAMPALSVTMAANPIRLIRGWSTRRDSAGSESQGGEQPAEPGIVLGQPELVHPVDDDQSEESATG